MKILLIEDDVSKDKAICSFFSEFFGNKYEIIVKRSIMAGKIELKKHEYKCILLDMSLPLFDNEDLIHNRIDNYVFDPFGGIVVLDEIDRIGLQCNVIIITAYDVLGEGENRKDLMTLTTELKKDYPNLVTDLIYYNASSSDWVKQLTTAIQAMKAE